MVTDVDTVNITIVIGSGAVGLLGGVLSGLIANGLYSLLGAGFGRLRVNGIAAESSPVDIAKVIEELDATAHRDGSESHIEEDHGGV